MTSSQPLGRLLTAKAAAAYLGVPYVTLRDWAQRGDVPFVRPPHSVRMWFDVRDLERAIERWKERPDEPWEERLERLKAAADKRRRQRPAAAPTISNRVRGRRPGVKPARGETSGAAAGTVPVIVPNGDGPGG
jgi:excisionase family DNA binding protein